MATRLTDDGVPALFELLHEARPVLLDLTGGAAAGHPGWATARSVLIRPDGHVGWACDVPGDTPPAQPSGSASFTRCRWTTMS
ncbi:hypothetical protein ACIBEJ_47520 [Nonomuraea sp. NPDC050790]|uniref:hypothetical protein n=1 Tax=Nonomuraea sp. NPDC050790 TaxID=3364371 RepID=UPI003793429C